jgi:hypothetical protein
MIPGGNPFEPAHLPGNIPGNPGFVPYDQTVDVPGSPYIPAGGFPPQGDPTSGGLQNPLEGIPYLDPTGNYPRIPFEFDPTQGGGAFSGILKYD